MFIWEIPMKIMDDIYLCYIHPFDLRLISVCTDDSPKNARGVEFVTSVRSSNILQPPKRLDWKSEGYQGYPLVLAGKSPIRFNDVPIIPNVPFNCAFTDDFPIVSDFTNCSFSSGGCPARNV